MRGSRRRRVCGVVGVAVAGAMALAVSCPGAASANQTAGYPVGVFGVTLGTGVIGGSWSLNPAASGPVMHASVTGTYSEASTREATLAAVRATRQEAYDEDVPVIASPATTKMGVREWLMGRGISESAYVNIGWSDQMEAIAEQRAAEASMYSAHVRPNWFEALPVAVGMPGATQSPTGEYSDGEVLGYGYSDPGSTITDGYDAEKATYLADGAVDNSADGHYAEMINPTFKTVGMSRITLADGYPVDAGEFGLDASDTSAGVGPSGQVTVPFEAAPGLITVDSASLPANQMQVGDSEQMSVAWVSTAQFRKETFGVAAADVAADGTFTSSNPAVATVAADGTVTGVSAGTCTLTYTESANHTSGKVTVQVVGVGQTATSAPTSTSAAPTSTSTSWSSTSTSTSTGPTTSWSSTSTTSTTAAPTGGSTAPSSTATSTGTPTSTGSTPTTAAPTGSITSTGTGASSTPDSPSSTATSFSPHGGIGAKWQSLGGASGTLGAPTSDEIAADGGVYETFRGGIIFWTFSTGAQVVHAGDLVEYQAVGSQHGALGFPTTDEVGTVGGGTWQGFQGGAILWSPATGSHVTIGAVRSEWLGQGNEHGYLGFPTTDEVGTVGGGTWQGFQGGAILWSPSSGAHTTIGAIRSEWLGQGNEHGYLGFPTSDEVSSVNGGTWQNYQGGAILWSPSTGAHETRGGVRIEWLAQGNEHGWLGYPTSDEIPTGNGTYQTFQGGVIRWTPATGAHASRS